MKILKIENKRYHIKLQIKMYKYKTDKRRKVTFFYRVCKLQWWKHVFGKVEPFKYHTKNYIQSTWFQYKYNIKVFMIWAKKYFKYISMCPLTKKDVWLYQVFCHEAKRGKLKFHGSLCILVVSKEKTSKYDSHLKKESALLLMIMI